MRLFVIFGIFIICLNVHSQKSAIIFFNKEKAKSVQLIKGSMAVLEYQGYLKQLELNANYIVDINDTTIFLGKPNLFSAPKEIKEIRISDIRGFRKISAGSQLLKTALTVGATLGTYFAMRNYDDELSSTQQIIYSTGAGLITRVSLKLIFPDNKIKYKLKNNWKIFVR